jgi:hypothetical protein
MGGLLLLLVVVVVVVGVFVMQQDIGVKHQCVKVTHT